MFPDSSGLFSLIVPVGGALIATFGGILLRHWLQTRHRAWAQVNQERTRYLKELVTMRDIETVYLDMLAEQGDNTPHAYKRQAYARAEELGHGKPTTGPTKLKQRLESLLRQTVPQ